MESNKLHEISIIDRKIFIDGSSINGIKNIEVDIGVHSTPTVEIEVVPNRLELEILAKLDIKPELTDIYDAIKCIRIYMILDHEFKKAVIASAKSVIDEIRNANRTDVVNDYEMASRIVERIFMGERK